MTQQELQAWRWHRQGLDGRLAGRPAAEVLRETGWARSVGGANPYLTLFARAGLSREAVDAAAAAVEIHELPSARGCTYVLPAEDFALGLTAGQESGSGERNTARKLGVSDKEIDKLREAVVRALAKGPLEPDELRTAVGGAARSLGEEGRKKGLSTTMPVALGELQLAGEIRRLPLNGRLDQQRYRYALWRPNPLAKTKLTPEAAHTELARRFFAWIGPATSAEFQKFAGLGVKAAKAALEPLGLEPAQESDEYLLLPEHREALRKFRIPQKPQYALIGTIDGLTVLRGDIDGLIAPADREKYAKLLKATGVQDLAGNAIVDRGRIVGLWEYDPARESIAWMSFVAPNPAMRQAVERTEEYVRTQLGDARSFGLDSPKSRAPKIAALRQAAGAR